MKLFSKINLVDMEITRNYEEELKPADVFAFWPLKKKKKKLLMSFYPKRKGNERFQLTVFVL